MPTVWAGPGGLSGTLEQRGRFLEKGKKNMKKGIRLNPKDNVVTVLDDIALPHKLALRDIKAGDYVIKYGEIMGYATVDIPAGRHVHDHNCDSEKLMK